VCWIVETEVRSARDGFEVRGIKKFVGPTGEPRPHRQHLRKQGYDAYDSSSARTAT
jgi:hypothetical protein